MLKTYSKILLLIIFGANIFLAQTSIKPAVEIFPYILQNDSTFECYISYRVPYNRLVFTKDNDNYKGGIEFLFEFISDGVIKKRTSQTNNFAVADFALTHSKLNYCQGVVKTELLSSEFEIHPSVKVLNTTQIVRLKPIHINAKNSDIIYSPLVISSGSEMISQNIGSTIPYDSNSYDLLVRSANPIVKTELYQNKKMVGLKKYNKSLTLKPSIKNKEMIFITDSTNTFFVRFKNVNKNLDEGSYKIKLFTVSDTIELKGKVEWFNRPISLIDVEFAIDILKHVFNKDIVKKLKDYPEEIQYKELKKFWKTLDKNSNTAFNELMYEFYNRVDIAIREFKSVNNSNGAATPMGGVFIKYGKPDDVKRSYSENYKTVEVWKYENLDREFVFVDRKGLGNFELVE